MPTFAIETPRQEDVLALMREGDEYALSLYPAEHYYSLDLDALERPEVAFFVARDDRADGTSALGTAALVDRGDGSAEIKRMFVTGAARGLGIGRGLLDALERHARASGIRVVQLETGLLLEAAVALYERAGYLEIPRFGPYVDDPTSHCMEKHLL